MEVTSPASAQSVAKSAELGYFNPNNVIFSPWNANFTGEPPSKCDWDSFE